MIPSESLKITLDKVHNAGKLSSKASYISKVFDNSVRYISSAPVLSFSGFASYLSKASLYSFSNLYNSDVILTFA